MAGGLGGEFEMKGVGGTRPTNQCADLCRVLISITTSTSSVCVNERRSDQVRYKTSRIKGAAQGYLSSIPPVEEDNVCSASRDLFNSYRIPS